MARPSLLNPDQLRSELSQLPGWSELSPDRHDDGSAGIDQATSGDSAGNALVREFKFKNFSAAFGFMAAVATAAERMGHHPDWSNSYNRVTVQLVTHDVGGVTSLDVELAHEMSDLAAPFGEAAG